ncbi:MAG: NADH:flavin oxidoreductase [Bacteroidales bacterium]|nr:NADH:flavin oxidoreductase [Bacteroidales bacterium]
MSKGKLTLTNRLIMPPVATEKSNSDGTVSKALLDYYDGKSRGGYISLFIIEHSFITQQGKASEFQLSVADDLVIPGLQKLAQTIHKNGSKAVMQINHAGSATIKYITGQRTVGPSSVANPRKGFVPMTLTVSQIQEIVDEFVRAAVRVQKAGFDGVEIHSAHGYLLNQFFSPLSNKRTDRYGGDVMGRITIHLEVIKAIRSAVGNDFPIILHLGACDYMEGGTTIEESKMAAVEFEKAGIDILDITGGFCGYTPPDTSQQGYFSPLSAELKKVVSIPVILAGGITNAQAAEQILANGTADLIGVGRAMQSDSRWAENAIKGLISQSRLN